ncbi:MAG: YafY family transcriptional regulator [Chitinophagaceae bacterium]|nr:YafY family transcriptional regulator [Chitinophagaceae bacterium]
MNRIDRLFGILTLLQSKKYVTAERISEKFDISVRTVYRDVKALGEQGVPVSFEQHKGYFIVQGYFLPPVAFNSEEANALLLMETLVAGFADQSIVTHYSSALNKVKAVLKNSQKEKLEAMSNNIRMRLPDCVRPNFSYLSILQEALSSKLIIEIEYKNNKAESSLRKAEPIGLVFYAFAWHVIGWCHLRKEYRDFKVARIVTIRLTDIPFTKAKHMLLSEYMEILPAVYESLR